MTLPSFLPPSLPPSLLCVQEQFEAQTFLLTSIVGHFSLLPLFYTPHMTPVKVR